jgi:hypothetical protein
LLGCWPIYRIAYLDLVGLANGVNEKAHQAVIVHQRNFALLVVHEISQQEQNLFGLLLSTCADDMECLDEVICMLPKEL